MRRLILIVMALGLAACAGAPKKNAPTASAHPVEAPAPSGKGRKTSPYAPAQEDPSKRGDYVAGGLYAPGVRDSIPDDIPDVDAIPEPDVTNEPRSPIGNRSNYTVLGKKYHVLDNQQGYVETGIASFYGKKFHGRRTSNLEVYDMYAFSAAHRTLPLPSFARVTNLDNGKSVIVRVNDRGPFHEGRLIDLSYAAATKLGYVNKGTARVEVRALVPGEDEREIAGERNDIARGSTGKASGIDRLVAAMPVATAAAADQPGPRTAAGSSDYRFDMGRDGHPMSAAEFDAWMKSRQLRIATGKPDKAVPTDAAVSPAITTEPAHPATEARDAMAGEDRVILQVASFSARANADRALAMLKNAGIDDAAVSDADARGQKVWRLRVGPLSAAAAPELAARIVGLGFGPPQRVRE